MFDIGWSELLIVGIVALIVIGPKELPGALRTLGQWMGKIRRMASEFQGQFQEAMREAEFADLKKEMDEMSASAETYGRFDPLEDLGKDIEKSVGELPELETPSEATQIASSEPESPPAEAPPSPPGEAAAEAEQPAASQSAKADEKPDAGRAPA